MNFATEAERDEVRAAVLAELIASGQARKTGKRSMLLGRRVEFELPRHFGSSLPRIRANRAAIVDKNGRWRRKMAAAGRCVRCGTPCAPYACCDRHRHIKRLCGVLSALVRQGEIHRVGPGLYSK